MHNCIIAGSDGLPGYPGFTGPVGPKGAVGLRGNDGIPGRPVSSYVMLLASCVLYFLCIQLTNHFDTAVICYIVIFLRNLMSSFAFC